MQNLALRYIQIDMYTYMSMNKIRKTLCERESRSARKKGGYKSGTEQLYVYTQML